MSIEVEGVVIGVAVRGEVAREEFVRALDPLRADRVGNHNYTVWFSENRRTFHRLQWGGCTVVRTRDPERLGVALARHLSGHGAPSAGLLRTDAVVAIHDGRATVLPPTLRQAIPVYGRPLREAGVLLVDAPWVDVDPHTAEVVLEPPRLTAIQFDEALRRLPPAPRPEPVPEPGRYAVAEWYFSSAAPRESMSVIDAVATVLGGLRRPLTDGRQGAAVAAMFEHTPFGRKFFGSPRELMDQIRA